MAGYPIEESALTPSWRTFLTGSRGGGQGRDGARIADAAERFGSALPDERILVSERSDKCIDCRRTDRRKGEPRPLAEFRLGMGECGDHRLDGGFPEGREGIGSGDADWARLVAEECDQRGDGVLVADEFECERRFPADPGFAVLQGVHERCNRIPCAQLSKYPASPLADRGLVQRERANEGLDRDLPDRRERQDDLPPDRLVFAPQHLHERGYRRRSNPRQCLCSPSPNDPVLVVQRADERADEGLAEFACRPDRVPSRLHVPVDERISDALHPFPLCIVEGSLTLPSQSLPERSKNAHSPPSFHECLSAR